jgi:Ankyrin repeats (3 copies)
MSKDRIASRLPIFAVLGMRPRQHKFVRMLPQLPPSWPLWLSAFRILLEKDASVHEVVYNRTLTNLNLVKWGPEISDCISDENILEYFKLLSDHCYIDFDSALSPAAGQGNWCAIVTAIRSRTYGLEALTYLQFLGVNLKRIYEDGKTALHWAAEMCYDVGVIEYLCTGSDIASLNRQDQCGWTPLHYAVTSQKFGYKGKAYEKVSYLLTHGADPRIKGRAQPVLTPRHLNDLSFTPFELSKIWELDLTQQLGQELKKLGIEVSEADEEADEFHDALEQQIDL